MVERALETVVKWTWVGPALVTVILAMTAAWALNMNARVMKLEDVVVSIDKQNVVQQGQYDLIITRLNIMSQRLETLVQQHVAQGLEQRNRPNQYNFNR